MKEHSSRHWSKLFHAVFTVAPAAVPRVRATVRVPSSGVGECARTMRTQWTIFTFQGETRGGAPLYSPIHE